MGLPLLSLIFLSLGFIFFPLLVQSQQPPSHRSPPQASPPTPTPPPPPPSPSRRPPVPKRHIDDPKHSNLRPPSNPSDLRGPKSHTEPGHSNVLPGSNSPGPPSRSKTRIHQQPNYNRNSQENKEPPSKYSKQRKHSNLGKKVGFFFVGAAAFLQVCMVTFLLVRRGQLMKVYDRF